MTDCRRACIQRLRFPLTDKPNVAIGGLNNPQAKVACRNGHMYARRIMDVIYPNANEAPLREAEEGVVRLSLVHYNTMEEVERCIEAIKTCLS